MLLLLLRKMRHAVGRIVASTFSRVRATDPDATVRSSDPSTNVRLQSSDANVKEIQ